MFGDISGLGMSIITFDWSQIGYIGSPLPTPCKSLHNDEYDWTMFTFNKGGLRQMFSVDLSSSFVSYSKGVIYR